MNEAVEKVGLNFFGMIDVYLNPGRPQCCNSSRDLLGETVVIERDIDPGAAYGGGDTLRSFIKVAVNARNYRFCLDFNRFGLTRAGRIEKPVCRPFCCEHARLDATRPQGF